MHKQVEQLTFYLYCCNVHFMKTLFVLLLGILSLSLTGCVVVDVVPLVTTSGQCYPPRPSRCGPAQAAGYYGQSPSRYGSYLPPRQVAPCGSQGGRPPAPGYYGSNSYGRPPDPRYSQGRGGYGGYFPQGPVSVNYGYWHLPPQNRP